VAADARSPLYGNAPTFRENGVDLTIGAFHGVFAPKGTPAAVVKKVADALQAALGSRELNDRMNDVGAAVLFLRGAQAQAYLDNQDKSYSAIIEALGLRVAKAP
jgi:tripartite-type tricarboxylate transporter receptor subunit TctC